MIDIDLIDKEILKHYNGLDVARYLTIYDILKSATDGTREELALLAGDELSKFSDSIMDDMEKMDKDEAQLFSKETHHFICVLYFLYWDVPSSIIAENRTIIEVVPKQAAQRGRKTRPFRDYIIGGDKDGLLAKLHQLFKENKSSGRLAAMIIYVCIKDGLICDVPFTAVQTEFDLRCNRSGYNKYKAGTQFTPIEINGIRERLK